MGVERVSKEELESILGKPATNQYVRFKLHGQSFIYHQIRKMIGSMVQMFQEDQDASFLDNSFTFNKTPIWLAPSNGLLLDRVTSGWPQIHFTGYNKKEDTPEPLNCTETELKAIADFKRDIIYPIVLQAEEKSKVFTQWLMAGREYNALSISKDPNFFSNWCNDDMVFNTEGNIDFEQLKFTKAEKDNEE